MMDLSQKIKLAEQEIKKAYENNDGKIFVSFSGGKDSRVLMDIAQRLYPDIKVVFSDTTNELAEIYRYVKSFDNVIWVKPKMTFFQVIEKYGFPLVSKENSQKISELKYSMGAITKNTRLYGDHKGNGKLPNKWRFLAQEDFDVTHKCCGILKKEPLKKWAHKNDMIPLIALMKDESKLRTQLALYGSFEKKIYPFLTTGWTEADIWKYSDIFNIRFAECYYYQKKGDKIIPKKDRTGCEFCGFGLHLEKNRFERSKLVSPKRYKKAMSVKNSGISFKKAIDMIQAEELPIPRVNIYGYKKIKEDPLIFTPVKTIGVCSYCKSNKVEKIFHNWTFSDGNIRFKVRFFDLKCFACGKVSLVSLPFLNRKTKKTQKKAF